LTFREDPQSRENMERVKKALHAREEALKREALKQTASALSGAEVPSVSRASQSSDGRSKIAKSMPYRSRVMSDREADKWLKRLQRHQRTRAYKIDVSKPDEGAEYAKPW